jgi:preprotein translocase subunit SecY
MAVFFIVVYAEGVKVEIPIAFERVRGLVPKLPLKYFYTSNIPVIFASALLLNVQLFAGALAIDPENPPTIPFTDIDISGVIKVIGYVDPSTGVLRDGILYYITPVHGIGRDTITHFTILATQPSVLFGIPEWVHALTYITFLSLFSILFGMFWVETANMDAKSVANQLSSSGLQIPGFRRDPRMLEKILQKHIFPLTVLGSLSVGLLAGIADLTGALGTGTGILLTVGILYRMYEQMEKMQMFDLYPALKGLSG